MVIIGIRNGLVELHVNVDDLITLAEMYPEHILMNPIGEETIGWTYDGVSFTPPAGG